MITVKPKEYAEMLRDCYKVKQPLFVEGGYGIGKSAIPRQVFSDIANERNLTYIEWSDASVDQKEECISNPDEYFVLYDARTSQMDTTSLQGIPNMNRTDRLENIPYSWVIYFTKPEAHGVIFFDEINLAAPIVQSITYSAILDRVICDRRLADDVYVFAAGNRTSDRGHTYEMAKPLKDRFAEFELVVNPPDWLEWARHNGVNPHLIAFITWRNSFLDTTTGKTNKAPDNDKPATPRGIVRASNLIKGLNFITKAVKINQLVSISVGEAFATTFGAYCTSYAELDWKKIFSNPESIKDMGLSHQYAVAGGLTELYEREDYSDKAFEKVMSVVLTPAGMKKDLCLYVIRTMKDFNASAFGDHARHLEFKPGVSYGKQIVKDFGKLCL